MISTIFWLAYQLILLAITFAHVVLGYVLAKLGRGPYRKYPDWPAATAFYQYLCFGGAMDPKFLRYLNSTVAVLLKLVLFFHSKATTDLPDYGKKYDSHSYWVARHPNSRPLILYCHGGAYVRSALPPQIDAMVAVLRYLRPEKSKVSMLVLDYPLIGTGTNQWPRQLHLLHETYQNLVDDGFNNVILFGDSAGGHLAITYLQYLRRFPKIPKPESLVAISPWVKLTATKDEVVQGSSYADNAKYDAIQFGLLNGKPTREYLIGTNKVDSLTVSPGNCPGNRDDWDLCMPKNVLTIIGEDEYIRDDILKWTYYATDCPFWKEQKYGNSNNRLVKEKFEFTKRTSHGGHQEVFVEPWGLHNALMVAEGPVAIREWEKGTKFNQLDRERMFSLSRTVNFLNEIL